MPDITIEQTTFARLQGYAKALVDTADTVVNRALDALDALNEQPRAPHADDPVAVDHEVDDPRQVPNLTHTKVLAARVGDADVEKPNWNRLLDRVVVLAMGYAGSFERLDRICPANMVRGPKTVDGYHHLREIDVSVQGLSAKEAGFALMETARRSGTGLEITFLWRDKAGAEYPGETGRLTLAHGPGAG